MATPEIDSIPEAVMTTAKFSFIKLLAWCAVAVVIAAGGTAGAKRFLAHRGKLTANAAVSDAASGGKYPRALTHPEALEPLLINLADDGGHAYLRLSLVLEEEDDPSAAAREPARAEEKPAMGADASVRDTILDVLGRQDSTDLLAPDGKEKLKSELMAAIDARNPELRVRKIYFTDFLVQR